MSGSRRTSPSPAVRPIARHGRQRTPNAALSILKFLGIALSVVLVSTMTVTSIAAWDLSRQVKTVHLGNEQTIGKIPEISAIDGGVNLLLIGSDSRANSVYSYGEDPESELNDVNILLHISQDHTNAVAVSFPRDTYVEIPECEDGQGNTNGPVEESKINTALDYGGGSANGGLACAVKTVENLTGLVIPFAAEITFDGVIEMSNAVGGVPVCVAQDIEDDHTELYLPAGVHDLQGMDALKFLRTRYGVGDGSDITRISSQQVFLSSLVRKVKSASTLTDVTKLYGLAGAAVRNMTFSDSLKSVDTMVQIAKALAPIDLDKIVFVQYPTVESYDQSGLYPNSDAADALFSAIQADQPIALSAPDPENATGSVPAPGTETPAPTEAPSDTATDAPAEGDPSATPTPTDGGVAQMPSGVLGQSAAQETCSVGRSLDDQ
ncbi:LCP family protein [Naasia aerilata]|uniref:Transcriptional regulator n=1 Tax=Naasia aerilata TaxID=1162966 RepID=A0ABN6XPI7_9MICO|nr:LCP family protein [Naasia aerilata]BDZ45480.1 transcriptional regulator [Naasia aerilata]